jgi:murein DD-endopeptidase MepM/ murein hydrolase activator NlpD
MRLPWWLVAVVVAGMACSSATSAVRDDLDWPVEPVKVSSQFGLRRHPVYGQMKSHQGVDLVAAEGQPVSAAAEGRVVKAEWMRGYGYLVEVAHGSHELTAYGHLSQILVAVGQPVALGQTVGLAGHTGDATGSHVHFEVWKDGKPCDPLRTLRLASN